MIIQNLMLNANILLNRLGKPSPSLKFKSRLNYSNSDTAVSNRLPPLQYLLK